MVEGAGAAALTVHGRTAADMFRGSADWDRIAAIKPHLKRIPLIGNGDLDSPRKVVDAFRRYDIDGVMIARASLAKPWLFRQAAAALRGEPVPPDPTLAEERELLLHHFDLICQRFGDAKGTLLMRKYACCYAQGRRGAREFRSRVVKVSTPAEFRAVVDEWFPRRWSTHRPPDLRHRDAHSCSDWSRMTGHTDGSREIGENPCIRLVKRLLRYVSAVVSHVLI